MTPPAQMNNKDLKIAWVIKWKNPHIFILWERLKIMKPSWLKVERAIIFLKSVSNIPLRAEKNIVILEIVAIINVAFSALKIVLENRIIK